MCMHAHTHTLPPSLPPSLSIVCVCTFGSWSGSSCWRITLSILQKLFSNIWSSGARERNDRNKTWSKLMDIRWLLLPVYKNFPGLLMQNWAPDARNIKVTSTSPVIVAGGVLTAMALGLNTCIWERGGEEWRRKREKCIFRDAILHESSLQASVSCSLIVAMVTTTHCIISSLVCGLILIVFINHCLVPQESQSMPFPLSVSVLSITLSFSPSPSLLLLSFSLSFLISISLFLPRFEQELSQKQCPIHQKSWLQWLLSLNLQLSSPHLDIY